MDKKPFFSIVMPVYGVEPYLRKAVQSVIDQTFKDFEIILVNDCSPDGSAAICKEFSEQYGNIRTLTHTENKGLSAARNTGLADVKGEYVWFMDSDDHVDPELLEAVYNSLQKNMAEAVVFGCVEEYYNKSGEIVNSIVMRPEEAYCKTADEVHSQIMSLETGTYYGYAWNKFYSVKHIRELDLKYENIVLIEDIKFNIKFCNDISSMNILPITPYHYAKRGTTSLTAKFVPDYYAVHRERVQLLYEQQCAWGTADQSTKSTLAGIYTRYLFSALSRNCDKRAEMNHSKRKQWLKTVYDEPLFNELMPHSAPTGTLLKIMSGILKKKRIFSALFLGRTIFLVQNKLQGLFVKAKQVRK